MLHFAQIGLFVSPDLEKMKILIVEDEEALLFGLQKILQNPEMTVDTARNLQEAKDLLGQNAYDAVLTDLRLTAALGQEGIEVAQSARELQKNCKIIMMTAYSENMLKESANKLGVDVFLEKPVTPNKIREILGSIGSETKVKDAEEVLSVLK